MRSPRPSTRPSTTPEVSQVTGWRAALARPSVATGKDYARRVFNGLGDNNAFFLAGGVAFSMLLALVPLVLLTLVGLAFALGREPADALNTVMGLTTNFLPRESFEVGALLRTVLEDVLRTRGAVGIGAGLGFVWTSTRLFGSLRAVLSIVLGRNERGIVHGKLFDVGAALASIGLVVVYVVFSAYLTMASTRSVEALGRIGVSLDALGPLAYALGRLLSLGLLAAVFFALYRGLPHKRPSREAAMLAGLTAGVLFEVARSVYGFLLGLATPNSLYTGSIAIIVSIVFWVYYGALLFLVGAEVVRAHELRQEHADKLAREQAREPSRKIAPA